MVSVQSFSLCRSFLRLSVNVGRTGRQYHGKRSITDNLTKIFWTLIRCIYIPFKFLKKTVICLISLAVK